MSPPRGVRLVALVLLWILSGVVVWTVAAAHAPRAQRDLRTPVREVTITAAVRREKLSEIRVVRGEVVAGFELPVAPPRSVPGVRAVVTKAPPAAGATIDQGQELFAVAARPTILLTGTVPLYRDLSDGMRGDDVTELQSALSAIGLGVPPSEVGTFGAHTRSSIRRLYERVGSTPPIVSDAPGRAADLLARLGDLDTQIQQNAAAPAGAAGADLDALSRQRAAIAAQLAAAVAQSADPTWGVQAWPDELVLVPSATVTVGASDLELGHEAGSDSTVAVRGGDSRVWVAAPTSSGSGATAEVPAVGATATASAATGGDRLHLTVASVGSRLVDGKPVAGWWATSTDGILPSVGTSIVIDLVTRTTASEVLTVPVAALDSSGAGDVVHRIGRTTETAESGGAGSSPASSPTAVPVQVGMIANGRAEVTASGGNDSTSGARDRSLEAGDRVVLGRTGADR